MDVDEKTKTCPACGASWIGEPIPEEDQHLFGGAKSASRLVGKTDWDLDMVCEWICPDCDARWDRFTGERLD